MKPNKFIEYALIFIASFLTLCGILFLIFVIKCLNSVFEKTIGYAASAALLAISLLIWYILILGHDKKNFFLYNPKKRTSITIDELTIETTIEKLDKYFGAILSKKGSFMDVLIYKSIPKVYIPLFSLWFLNACIEIDKDNVWNIFGIAPKDFIDAFGNTLFISGAIDISQKIQYLKATFDGDASPIREYFMGQKQHIKDLVLIYVKANIEKF